MSVEYIPILYEFIISSLMRLESVKMFPIIMEWKFILWISCRWFRERSLVHSISSVPVTSRGSTMIQNTDIRCLSKMTDIAHLVRDNFYFQSAPKPVGQEVTKGKKPATQNWSVWARPNKRWWEWQRYKVGTHQTNKGFIQAPQQTFGKWSLSPDHMQFTLNYLSVVLVGLHC